MIENIIQKWIEENTVPYNTRPNKSSIPIYVRMSLRKPTNKRDKKSEWIFNRLCRCSFIMYKSERRILLKNPSYKFAICCGEEPIEFKFKSLIDKLIDARRYTQKDKFRNLVKEYITISLTEVQEVLDYFGISYNFKDENKYCHLDYDNRGLYKFEFDGYRGAEEYYRDSELYKKINSYLIEYFNLEIAPYKKYNPDFNQYKYAMEGSRILTVDDVINNFSFDQILNAITGKYFHDGCSLLDISNISIDKIELFRKEENKEIFKNVLSGIFKEDELIRVVRATYNL